MNKATLDYSASQKLLEAMAKVPERSEKLVNDVLRTSGTAAVMNSIIGFMPVSDRKKRHAKHSKPLKAVMFNLGFDIIAKGGAASNKNSFGYLVFPNEGRGSHNPVAQLFFERGLERVEDMVLDDVLAALQQAQEETLNI